ncbi:MAG: DJ-1/PfpI family protein [Alphaproteobacteria bacterium]|nr:DJ-1/PfpI family protein [Alphaproteobacteria bacterium]
MTLHIGFLVFPRVQQLDLTGPYEIFSLLPSATVHLVWKDREIVTSTTGIGFTPTTTFAECPMLDVLCVPGGIGVNPLMQDAETLAFVRRQAERARFVTSVCTGSLVLGAAGLLEGRRATAHWLARDALAGLGAIPTAGRVVRDGNLITAGGVTAGIDFGLTVVAELAGREAAETIQLHLEYAPAPPFDAGTPETAPPPVVAAVRDRLAGSRAERQAIIAAVGRSPATV